MDEARVIVWNEGTDPEGAGGDGEVASWAYTGRMTTSRSGDIGQIFGPLLAIAGAAVLAGCSGAPGAVRAGNPVIAGWYADPEGVVFEDEPSGHRYWIYPTFSAPYDDQLHFDAFSSPDLLAWMRHERVLTSADIAWARRAMWAPAVIEKGGRYYFFFGANDIQGDPKDQAEIGGIGVAVADRPEGPYRDHIGRPLIDRFHNGAQPIDQFVFRDRDGAHYLIYGGWRRCNIARLNETFTGFVPMGDGPAGETFVEITPRGYVEGPFMFTREIGSGDSRRVAYYFMWSEGGWTGPDYSVAYAMSDSVHGPFERIGKVLEQDGAIATGAGHHSVMRGRDEDSGRERWYIVYHRRPLGETDRNARVVCIDRLEFNDDGTIRPVRMTFEGVERE